MTHTRPEQADPRRWYRSETIQFRPLVDGGILYDEHGACVHHLNETARMIWDLCSSGATIHQIVTQVCSGYDVSQAQAERDVSQILRQMSEAGVLR